MSNLENILLKRLETAKAANATHLVNAYQDVLIEAGLLVQSKEVTLSGTVGNSEDVAYEITITRRKDANWAVIGMYEDGEVEVIRQSKTYKAAKDAAYAEMSDYQCRFSKVFITGITSEYTTKAA